MVKFMNLSLNFVLYMIRIINKIDIATLLPRIFNIPLRSKLPLKNDQNNWYRIFKARK